MPMIRFRCPSSSSTRSPRPARKLAIATNNGVLALQAMGLGGWTYDGLDRLSVLGGSGDPRAPGLGFVADDDERWPFPKRHRTARIL